MEILFHRSIYSCDWFDNEEQTYEKKINKGLVT